MRIRKALSIATAGVVRFRNPIENEFDKRRRQSDREAKREQRIESGNTLGALLGLKAYGAKPKDVPRFAAGWYQNQDDESGTLRWFDGEKWTEYTHPQ